MSSARVDAIAWRVASRAEGVRRVDRVTKLVHDPRGLAIDGTAVNPWDPTADREPVNDYDQILDALRTAALKRDAERVTRSSVRGSISPLGTG
jgi:hypothetical protein